MRSIPISEKISIDTDYIKLDSFLKLANLVMSGGEAKIVIQEGQISVNGAVETRRGRKLYPGDTITLTGSAGFVIERQ